MLNKIYIFSIIFLFCLLVFYNSTIKEGLQCPSKVENTDLMWKGKCYTTKIPCKGVPPVDMIAGSQVCSASQGIMGPKLKVKDGDKCCNTGFDSVIAAFFGGKKAQKKLAKQIDACNKVKEKFREKLCDVKFYDPLKKLNIPITMQGVHGIDEKNIQLGQLGSSFCTSVKPIIDKLSSPWANNAAAKEQQKTSLQL